MAEFSSLTLLYTAHLEGDLRLLPRLSSLIRREKQAARGPVILLDLGDTCAEEAWVCRATHGRAPFIVLDSMAYDAAIIGGPEAVPIPVPALLRLRETMLMPVIVWNTAGAITRRGITLPVISGSVTPPGGPSIRVDRSADPLPRQADPVLTLGDVPHGFAARVVMAWPEWTLEDAHLLEVGPDLPSDPTIAAIVDLVEQEARAYTRQMGGHHESG